MSLKYVDLTATELDYLAKRGHSNAHDALVARSLKGDIEAQHYLRNGNVSNRSGVGSWRRVQRKKLGIGNYGPSFSGCGPSSSGCGPSFNDRSPSFSGPSSSGCCGQDNGSLSLGEDMGPMSIADFIMPHKLIQRAIAAKGDPTRGWQQATGQIPTPSPGGLATFPKSIIKSMLPAQRLKTMVPPPPRLPPLPPLPKWGVFINYEQEPSETFDTLKSANEWASTIPQGVFFAVIHAGQEPPRPPYGWGEEDYQSAQQMAPSGGRPLSRYEAFQLQQGQRL